MRILVAQKFGLLRTIVANSQKEFFNRVRILESEIHNVASRLVR